MEGDGGGRKRLLNVSNRGEGSRKREQEERGGKGGLGVRVVGVGVKGKLYCMLYIWFKSTSRHVLALSARHGRPPCCAVKPQFST